MEHEIGIFVAVGRVIDRGWVDIDVTVGFGLELQLVGFRGLEHCSGRRLLILEFRGQHLDNVGVQGRT